MALAPKACELVLFELNTVIIAPAGRPIVFGCRQSLLMVTKDVTEEQVPPTV